VVTADDTVTLYALNTTARGDRPGLDDLPGRGAAAVNGSARLWVDGVWREDLKRGQAVPIEAGHVHIFEALEDGTLLSCITDISKLKESDMPWAAAAAAAASLAGGQMQADAASKASGAQTNATNRATDAQANQFATSRADLAPYRVAGASALSALTGQTGLTPGAPKDYKDWTRSDFVDAYKKLFADRGAPNQPTSTFLPEIAQVHDGGLPERSCHPGLVRLRPERRPKGGAAHVRLARNVALGRGGEGGDALRDRLHRHEGRGVSATLRRRPGERIQQARGGLGHRPGGDHHYGRSRRRQRCAECGPAFGRGQRARRRDDRAGQRL
jgi:hypothetical protein